MEQKPAPKKQVHDPTKASRSLAIALVVSAAFLLAAAGIATWLLVKGDGGSVASTVHDPDAQTKNVKDVSFIVPDLPAEYTKNDQSPQGATRTYYYSAATNCGIAVGVEPLVAGKSTKDTVMAAIQAGQQQDVAIVNSGKAQAVDLKDSDGSVSYSFDALDIEQTVNVPGIAYTRQNSTALYKQFGQKVAWLAYGCRAEEWQARKESLVTLVQTFTVNTER